MTGTEARALAEVATWRAEVGGTVSGTVSETVTGHQKLLEQLRADGVTKVFGNPGPTEAGLLDRLARFPCLDYVLGLQEAAVVRMADGYARARGGTTDEGGADRPYQPDRPGQTDRPDTAVRPSGKDQSS